MKKTSLLLLFLLSILRGSTTAQNPYESLGKVAPVLTLSEGKYQEFMTNDTLVEIGSVLFNTITSEVVAFQDDTLGRMDADMTTRFLSVDPIGRKYPELTPYQFASNTPIAAVDIDGLEGKQIHEITKKDGKSQITKITYELPIYVVMGTMGKAASDLTMRDNDDIKAYFTSLTKDQTYKDPETGVQVVFVFNVIPLDLSKKILQFDQNGKPLTDKKGDIQYKIEKQEVSINAQARAKGEIVDDGYLSLPAMVVGAPVSNTNGETDGGSQVGPRLTIDKKRTDIGSSTVHEAFHFMLCMLITLNNQDKNTRDHALRGILGRPMTDPYINNAILTALKAAVPRSSKDDTTIQE